jgi:iron(III) transport system permease protein
MLAKARPLSFMQRFARRISAENILVALAALISLIVALPLLSIAVMALAPAPGVWPHLVSTTLPYSVQQTLLLMAGVAALTLAAGAGTAWLITMYRFPGRGLFDWLLILPLALPTYITAYCYGEFLDFTGPVQSALRDLGGFRNYQDYWFPSIRSLGGAIFIFSCVLYPYVYLTARASFALQSIHVLEVARTLGRTGTGALFAVALPMARPALAAGLSLALMECLNDVGAVEYLGVRTLTLSVFDAWIQRSSISGAAQLALVMFFFVMALVSLERYGRRQHRFQTGRTDRPVPEHRLPGGKGSLAALACIVPLTVGFIVPVGVLVDGAIAQGAQYGLGDYARAAGNSLLLSSLAAIIVVVLALVLGAALRLSRGWIVSGAVRVSSLGYAIPGTVVALGLIVPLAGLDNFISGLMQRWIGVQTGLLLSGTAFALLLAYTVRFMAVAFGSVEAGWQRLSPNLDAAARTLGASPMRMLGSVHLPLLRPAIGAAALLVFVDTMKELPATLLLRPFNFETLATHIYVYASQEQFEHSAIAALTIVVVGLIPLILMHHALTGSGALSPLQARQPEEEEDAA